jgi:hypothetical protein
MARYRFTSPLILLFVSPKVLPPNPTLKFPVGELPITAKP